MKKITILMLGSILMVSPLFSAEKDDTRIPTGHVALHTSDGRETTERTPLSAVTPPAPSTAKLRSRGLGSWGCTYWEIDIPYSTISQTNSRESSS